MKKIIIILSLIIMGFIAGNYWYPDPDERYWQSEDGSWCYQNFDGSWSCW